MGYFTSSGEWTCPIPIPLVEVLWVFLLYLGRGFCKTSYGGKIEDFCFGQLDRNQSNDCKFMQSREDTRVERPTNGTCMEATCLHTNWKGEEGRFKRKRTILVSISKNPKPNLLENKLGETSFHLSSPCWKPALATGIKGSLSNGFSVPVEGVSFHVQWKTAKQTPVVISQRSDERLNFSPLWGCLLCHYSLENYLGTTQLTVVQE